MAKMKMIYVRWKDICTIAEWYPSEFIKMYHPQTNETIGFLVFEDIEKICVCSTFGKRVVESDKDKSADIWIIPKEVVLEIKELCFK